MNTQALIAIVIAIAVVLEIYRKKQAAAKAAGTYKKPQGWWRALNILGWVVGGGIAAFFVFVILAIVWANR